MSIDKFINYIDSNNDSDRISDRDIHLRKIRNEASTIINAFVNNVVNRIQETKLPHEQYGHFHEGIAGFRYLHNYLVFYPDSSSPMEIINVMFNGEIIDKLITENDRVISKEYQQLLSENLLEKYLSRFMD